jgi:hypothetical protein
MNNKQLQAASAQATYLIMKWLANVANELEGQSDKLAKNIQTMMRTCAINTYKHSPTRHWPRENLTKELERILNFRIRQTRLHNLCGIICNGCH